MQKHNPNPKNMYLGISLFTPILECLTGTRPFMKQNLFFHIVHECAEMLSYCQIRNVPVYSGSCGCLSVKGRVGRDGAGSPIPIHNMWCLLQRNVHGWNVYMY